MALSPRIVRTISYGKRAPIAGNSQKHLDWLKTLPSMVSGIEPAGDAHHLLGNVDGLPKGVGRTNSDRWAVPLTRAEHDAAHAAGNDEEHFRRMGIDARAPAAALWRESGNTDAAYRLLYRARVKT